MANVGGKRVRVLVRERGMYNKHIHLSISLYIPMAFFSKFGTCGYQRNDWRLLWAEHVTCLRQSWLKRLKNIRTRKWSLSRINI